MDKTGKIVISPEYYDAAPFKEGLARIQPWRILLSKAIRVDFIDKSGKILNMSKMFSYAEDFSEGLALVAVPGERSFGYIDTTGKLVIPQDDSHEMARSFHEGLAAIKEGGKWGYIDKSGKTVISPQFSGAYRFSEGLAAVKNSEKWGYVDKTGTMVVAPPYDAAYQRVEGLAAVKLGNRWGFIDKTGAMIISPQFDEVSGFSEGLALVKVGKKLGYIEKTGKYVWAPARLCHRSSQSRTPVAQRISARGEPDPERSDQGRLLLSDGEKMTLAEIAHRLGRRALEDVAATAKPDTILGWYRKLIAKKLDGSQLRRSVGRPKRDHEAERLVLHMARENPSWGYDRIVGALANTQLTASITMTSHFLLH